MATVTYSLPLTPMMLQAVVGDAAISYAGSDIRLLVGSIYTRSGRVGPGDSLMLYPRLAGADWSVDVQAGQAVIYAGPNLYAPERYLISLAARTNVPLTGFNFAPAATRTHAVYLVVDDKNISGTLYGARIIITEDTGSGAAAPSASYYSQLGTVTIAPAQSNIGSANIVNLLPRAARATPATAPSYYSGFAAGGGTGQGLLYSLDGNTVKLQGCVVRSSGNFAAATVYTVANIPVGYRPAYQRYAMTGANLGPAMARVGVSTGGDITVTPYGANAADMTYVALDSFSYEIY